MKDLSEQETFLCQARRIVVACGFRVGLRNAWKEECEEEFILKWLEDRSKPPAWELPPWRRDSLLRLAARNHVANYARGLVRRAQKECLLEDHPGKQGRAELAALTPTPEEALMNALFWKQIDEAMVQLAPRHRSVLLRFCFYGDTIEEIAQMTGRTVHAVEQCLYRARNRLSAVIIASAEDEEALAESLHPALFAAVRQRLPRKRICTKEDQKYRIHPRKKSV